MFTAPRCQHSARTRRFPAAVTLLAFVFTLALPPGTANAQSVATILGLPAPGTILPVSPGFRPPVMVGMTVHPDDPLMFDFIISRGEDRLDGPDLVAESETLIKYFLAGLTVPDDELWVNLSPYEDDRIISKTFGQTEMGRDLLAQDYLLKQLTASLMSPEDEVGRTFWARVYQKAQDRYGTSQIPLNTFNKVWIVPENAKVYVNRTSAFVVDSHLTVMLDADYLAAEAADAGQRQKAKGKRGADETLPLYAISPTPETDELTREVIREIVIPEIEKEINEGRTFARLRQVYQSMILAVWFKRYLRETLLGQIYMDQGKTAGVNVDDPAIKEKIYQQYLAAFKKGVYNLIQADTDPISGESIPRRYFSGGTTIAPKNIQQTGSPASPHAGQPAPRQRDIAEASRALVPYQITGLVKARTAFGKTPSGSGLMKTHPSITRPQPDVHDEGYWKQQAQLLNHATQLPLTEARRDRKKEGRDAKAREEREHDERAREDVITLVNAVRAEMARMAQEPAIRPLIPSLPSEAEIRNASTNLFLTMVALIRRNIQNHVNTIKINNVIADTPVWTVGPSTEKLNDLIKQISDLEDTLTPGSHPSRQPQAAFKKLTLREDFAAAKENLTSLTLAIRDAADLNESDRSLPLSEDIEKASNPEALAALISRARRSLESQIKDDPRPDNTHIVITYDPLPASLRWQIFPTTYSLTLDPRPPLAEQLQALSAQVEDLIARYSGPSSATSNDLPDRTPVTMTDIVDAHGEIGRLIRRVNDGTLPTSSPLELEYDNPALTTVLWHALQGNTELALSISRAAFRTTTVTLQLRPEASTTNEDRKAHLITALTSLQNTLYKLGRAFGTEGSPQYEPVWQKMWPENIAQYLARHNRWLAWQLIATAQGQIEALSNLRPGNTRGAKKLIENFSFPSNANDPDNVTGLLGVRLQELFGQRVAEDWSDTTRPFSLAFHPEYGDTWAQRLTAAVLSLPFVPSVPFVSKFLWRGGAARTRTTVNILPHLDSLQLELLVKQHIDWLRQFNVTLADALMPEGRFAHRLTTLKTLEAQKSRTLRNPATYSSRELIATVPAHAGHPDSARQLAEELLGYHYHSNGLSEARLYLYHPTLQDRRDGGVDIVLESNYYTRSMMPIGPIQTMLAAMRDGLKDNLLTPPAQDREKQQPVRRKQLQQQQQQQRQAAPPGDGTPSGTKTPATENLGGIDFDPSRFNLILERDENFVPLPMDRQPVNITVDGLIPVIIEMRPVTNLPLLLGLNIDSVKRGT